jgi:adenylyltransferase/sulfurtransferase
MLSDDELLRYSRQIMLPQVDIAGQERLKAARVLIIGLGGLGCPVALYLAAAGVGELWLADFDTVDASNLQRQVLHRTDDVGAKKVVSAAAKLRALNPLLSYREIDRLLDAEALHELVAGVDVVVDCTDNFLTRDAVNAACVAARKPLVSGAAIGFGGQLAVFDLRQADSPCYRCLYPDVAEAELACADSGVLASVVGVVGTLQAHEALKVVMGVGHTLAGRLWLWDGETMEMRTLRLKKDTACLVCGEMQ